jgi:hypothetical protein
MSSLTPVKPSGTENKALHPLKNTNSFFKSALNCALDTDGPDIVILSLALGVAGAAERKRECLCEEERESVCEEERESA